MALVYQCVVSLLGQGEHHPSYPMTFAYVICCSTKMAAAAVEEVCRETQVPLHRRSEGGHAALARTQNHQGPRGHVQPEVQTRQARLSRVSESINLILPYVLA